MIVIMKRSNIMLSVLIFVLVLGIIGVNLGLSNKKDGVEASTMPTLNTKGKVVVLDPGHGGSADGAKYFGSKEKDIK